MLFENYEIYVKPTELEISQRKLEGYRKLAEIQQWGRKHPTKFMKEFVGVELLDQQEWSFMNSWCRPFVLWLESRAAGKTTKLALFTMCKDLLFNNYRIYICSGTADQSQETFRKIEDIAKKNIESMTGLSDVFRSEVKISQPNSDGFIHNPAGYRYELYNGSRTITLNSNINRQRGKRSECVVFDEGGWLTEEDFNVIGAYTAQSSDFKLGGDVDADSILGLPKEFPHQLLYSSSASSADTAFYKKFKDFSMRMIAGDPKYFVSDLNCDVVMNATFHGKVFPTPLLTQETIDNEMRVNPEKGLREYYNHFSRDGGQGAIIKRAIIVRNSFVRPPLLLNTNNAQFVFAYDPARSTDNSICGIGMVYEDKEKGLMMDIVNVVSFVDLALRKKTPKMYQEQIKDLRFLLLDYNGGAEDYGNILQVLADAGSGGGGNSWVRDSLIEQWVDKKGVEHCGLVDKKYPNGEDYAARYPKAKDKLTLIEPAKMKAEMYEALIRMMESDLIHFPAYYDNKGYLNIVKVDEKVMNKSREQIRQELDKLNLEPDKYDEELEERLSMVESAKTEIYNLSLEEEIALAQIDAMKEEIVNIVRVKREGSKDVFRLPPHKDADTGVSDNTMHDDRAYVLAMLGWYLSELRVKNIRNKKKDTDIDDILSMMSSRAARR